MRLVYSQDDGGWYFQRFSDWKCTQLFKTEDEALSAKEEGKLEWS